MAIVKLMLSMLVGTTTLSSMLSCGNHHAAQATTQTAFPGPFEVFFDSLQIPSLTDTILVQAQSRVFGCGTAAVQHDEYLRSSGLQPFYDKYQGVLGDCAFLKKYTHREKIAILWVSRGMEGELLELSDSTLHADAAIEDRLFRSKCFLKFSETVHSLDSITVSVSIAYPIQKSALALQYQLSSNSKGWNITESSKDSSSDKEALERAYYP